MRPGKAARSRWTLAAIICVVLAGCSSTPRAPSSTGPRPAGTPGTAPNVSLLPPGTAERDGPDANPPPDLHLTPDAIPRIEPLRVGGPNKPYEVAGERYAPLVADLPVVERGLASWYGRKFHGRSTSNGEVYDMYAMTAAHKTMPLPSFARVRNPANGREVVVRINDRGPFAAGRIIDLSYTAALKLGLLGGVAPVEVERLTHEAIRTGAWQRGVGGLTTAQAPQPQAQPQPQPQLLAQAQPQPQAGSPDDPIALIAQREAQAEPAAPRRGWWLQLGAFRQRDGAAELRRQVERGVEALAPLLAVFSDGGTHRLQAGPWPSRDEALLAAARLREALNLVPALVERR